MITNLDVWLKVIIFARARMGAGLSLSVPFPFHLLAAFCAASVVAPWLLRTHVYMPWSLPVLKTMWFLVQKLCVLSKNHNVLNQQSTSTRVLGIGVARRTLDERGIHKGFSFLRYPFFEISDRNWSYVKRGLPLGQWVKQSCFWYTYHDVFV